MEKRIEALEHMVQELKERIELLESGSAQKTTISQTPPPPPTPHAIPKVPRPPRESIATGKLLAIVSVICFVLAGSFIIKLAIDSGWLTPARQWFLVIALGGTLCGLGRYLNRIENSYRAYLSAAGVIVLYMAAFTSSLYFGMVSEHFSMILGMGVSFLGMALFNYHRSEIFSVITVVGTYLSLLIFDRSMGFTLASFFFILWAGVFSWFSVHFKSRTVSLVAAYHGLGIYAFIHESAAPENFLMVMSVLTIQFVLFARGVFEYSLKNQKTLTTQESWFYFPVLCFYYGIMYYYVQVLSPSLAPWMALGFAALLYSAYAGFMKKQTTMDPLASREMVYGFLTIVLFQAGYLNLLPAGAKSWLLPVMLIMAYVSSQREDFPKLSKAFIFMGYAIGFVEFYSLCGTLLDKSTNWNALLVASATIGLGILYYLNVGKQIQSVVGTFLAGIHLIAILALYRLAEPFGSLVVSLGWAAYAILILVLGFKRQDKVLAKSSLLVLCVASVKALLYDASSAPSGVRIICLLLTGLLLYGTGLLFQRMQKWGEKEA